MPHGIVEYSENLGPEADIPGLLEKIANACRNTGGVLPVGGLRLRALPYSQYVVADGDPENAFVVITFKIAKGRSEEFKASFFPALFEMIKTHFAVIHATRPFSLALYLEEINEGTGLRWNSIHERLKAKAAAAADTAPDKG